eukprot:GHRQ01014454.1.p3 GENE.GHRQ01014454.1~~GHRQ01014454.1.p3  ORF type:complete len:118 (+),score=35.71 GHRQ01014454.1:30-356(+)
MHAVSVLCPAGDIAKPNAPHKPLPAGAGDEAIARLDKLRNAKGSLRTAEIRRTMQKVSGRVAGEGSEQQRLHGVGHSLGHRQWAYLGQWNAELQRLQWAVVRVMGRVS